MSCSKRDNRLESRKQFEAQKKLNEIKPIVFVDTLNNKLEYLEKYYKFGFDFYPVYTGTEKDTILMKYTSGYCYSIRDYDKKYLTDSESVAIMIDTFTVIGSAIGAPKVPKPESRFNSLQRKDDLVNRGNWYSYPVIVKNIGKDTLDIGRGDVVNLLPQVKKGKEGNWQDINLPFKSNCSPELRILIGPGNICITTIPILRGKTRSKLRLRFEGTGTYSNEINCYLNEAEL